MIRIGRPPRAARRWLGLLADIAAQTALGFGIAIIAITIYIRGEWL